MRALSDDEITELLAADTVAHLATVDNDGYPYVVPLWFLWADGAFHLTSYPDRPHLARIRADPRVGLVIDLELPQRGDGERPNRQLRVTGDATVEPDEDGQWTARIRRKYLDTGISPHAAERDLGPRAHVRVVHRTLRAVASV